MKPRTKGALTHALSFAAGVATGVAVAYALCRKAVKKVFWCKKPRLILLLFLLPALGANAQDAPNIETWNINPMVVASDVMIFFQHTSPAGDGVAYTIYTTPRDPRGHNGYVGTHIKYRSRCFARHRKISKGVAVPVSPLVPCNMYDRAKFIYLRSVIDGMEKKAPPLENLKKT